MPQLKKASSEKNTKYNNGVMDCKISFKEFIVKTFSTVDWGSDFIDNWHIDLMASALNDAYRGKITRLMINIPPRCLKSIVISVAWPAWILGHNPSAKIIAVSHAKSLSHKLSNDTRAVLMSQWYQALFPDTILSRMQNSRDKFMTTATGFRLASSVNSSIVGEGADFIIIDDPQNPAMINNYKYRKHTIDWLENSLFSRLNNRKKGVIVLVMQRLHEEDLCGVLNKKEHLLLMSGVVSTPIWRRIILPSIEYRDSDKRLIWENDDKSLYRSSGELLFPERLDNVVLKQIKCELGDIIFDAQYQQRPSSNHQMIFKSEWFRRYSSPIENEMANDSTVLSFDTAVKTGVANDYSVCTVWRVKYDIIRKSAMIKIDAKLYLLDVVRKKLEYPELKFMAEEMIEAWQPEAILIEDASSGASLIQDLRGDSIYNIYSIKHRLRSKHDRAERVSAFIASGKLYLPLMSDWLEVYEKELAAFPNGDHDDQVDSTTQAIEWWKMREMEIKKTEEASECAVRSFA